MKRRTILALLVLLIGVFAFAAVGCGGDDDDEDDASSDRRKRWDGGERFDLPPVTRASVGVVHRHRVRAARAILTS